MSKRKSLYITAVILCLICLIVGMGVLLGKVGLRFYKTYARGPLGGDTVESGVLWPDTVVSGTMAEEVGGSGTFHASVEGSLFATLEIDQAAASKVHVGQKASVYTSEDRIPGEVVRIGNPQQNGMVILNLSIEQGSSTGLSANSKVTIFVSVGEIKDTLQVGRPEGVKEFGTANLYKINNDGKTAIRVPVKFGRGNVNRLEVLEGLKAGDKVILNDISQYTKSDQINIR